MKKLLRLISLHNYLQDIAKERGVTYSNLLNEMYGELKNKENEIKLPEPIENKKELSFNGKEITVDDDVLELIDLLEIYARTDNTSVFTNEKNKQCKLIDMVNFETSSASVDGDKTRYPLAGNKSYLSKRIKKIIKEKKLTANDYFSEFKYTATRSLSFTPNRFTLRKSNGNYIFIKPTFLMIVALLNNNEIINDLLSTGTYDISTTDANGKTALDYFKLKVWHINPEEEKVITSKLDGTYNDGYYLRLYEENVIKHSINNKENKTVNKI